MTQATIQAIQKQLVALSNPPISSIKDSLTEGEKRIQVEEKAEIAVEEKGKKIVTQGESSFSHALEEGKIDKPYVPEYVDSLWKSSPLTKLKWTKRMSFADEYAFHNDCLFSGVDKVLS